MENNCSFEPAVNTNGQLVITLSFTPESGLSIPRPFIMSREESLKLAQAIIYIQGVVDKNAK